MIQMERKVDPNVDLAPNLDPDLDPQLSSQCAILVHVFTDVTCLSEVIGLMHSLRTASEYLQ